MEIRSLLGAAGVVVAVALTAAPAAVDAQAPDGRGRLAACQADLAALCPGIDAGGGRKMQCLAENRAKLSPECGAAVDLRLARKAAKNVLDAGVAAALAPPASPAPGGTATGPAASGPVAVAPGATVMPGLGGAQLAACRADMESLCGTVEKGRGARLQCLRQSIAKVSPGCAEAIQAIDRVRDQLRTVCAADRKQFCRGSDLKGLQCLSANQDKLSPACAAIVSALPRRPLAPGTGDRR